MNAITMNNLSKTYPTGKKAVDAVTFFIQKGEIFGFLGPNGAGKTTAVKLLTGLLKPTSGHCEVWGIDSTLHPEQVHKICGVVTEHSQMYDYMSGLENLTFYSTLFGLTEQEGKARALELLAKLDLMEAKDQKLATYSTGMRQRLSLARAMIHQPKVLFLDEPTSGLDPESILGVNKMIKELAEKEGVTIFLCTHQLRYAQELCTSYGLIDNGNMFAQGTLNKLRSCLPHSRSVEIKTDYMPDSIQAIKTSDSTYQIKIHSEDEIPIIVQKIVEQKGKIFHVFLQQMSLENIYFELLELDRKERGAHHD